jgi:hypothetical protein
MGSTLNKVVDVSVVRPFGLRVRFDDGASGVHDCAALLKATGSMIAPLRDPEFFARVTLDYGAPTWPNGYDMCPDWLRMEMQKAGELAGVAAE